MIHVILYIFFLVLHLFLCIRPYKADTSISIKSESMTDSTALNHVLNSNILYLLFYFIFLVGKNYFT